MRDFAFFSIKKDSTAQKEKEFSSFLEAILTTCYQIDSGNDEISVFFSPQIRPHIHQPEMGSEESLGWVWRGVAGAVSRILRWYNNPSNAYGIIFGFLQF